MMSVKFVLFILTDIHIWYVVSKLDSAIEFNQKLVLSRYESSSFSPICPLSTRCDGRKYGIKWKQKLVLKIYWNLFQSTVQRNLYLEEWRDLLRDRDLLRLRLSRECLESLDLSRYLSLSLSRSRSLARSSLSLSRSRSLSFTSVLFWVLRSSTVFWKKFVAIH